LSDNGASRLLTSRHVKDEANQYGTLKRWQAVAT